MTASPEGLKARPAIDPGALAAVLRAYPALGGAGVIVRNGLSINTPACLFEEGGATYFAKGYDPAVWDAEALAAEHALSRRLVAAGYPTPRLHENRFGETVTWHEGRPYAITDRARGEDRYGGAPVFAPYGHPEEASSAGAMLARFHRVFNAAPLPAPRPLRGLTARFALLKAPSVEAGLAALLAEAPVLGGFWGDRPELPMLRARLEAQHAALAPLWPSWPRGVIHGDFIKRNLFWSGREVVDVVDFDLWNVGDWVYDLALALLPTGFDWPALFAGEGTANGHDMRAFLAGYESVRPLEPAERAALPTLMEAARFEFYASAIAAALTKDDPEQAERFWALLVRVNAWFAAHPDWPVTLD
jgi:Ser/Thr protein kinase RdoA (MazF antagonist)